MKTMLTLRWLGVLSFVLSPAWVGAQPLVDFSNFGTGWAAPWYTLDGTVSNCVVRDSVTISGYATTGNSRLSGTGFTAELWAGPEGSTEWAFQPVSRTTFRTGTAAGLLRSASTPVPFATPGQRLSYQLRVWENRGGTITGWNQAMADSTVPRGTTPVYTSPPLDVAPITLEFRESFMLLAYASFPAPVLALSLDRCQWYGSFSLLPSVFFGEDVHLTVVCPNPATNFQWSFNGVPLSGETNATLSLPQVQAAHAGTYAAAVTTFVGSLPARMTNSMKLVLLPAPRLTQPRLHPVLGFSANVEGVTNRRIQAEFSADLRAWSPGLTQWIWGSFGGNTLTMPPPLPETQFHRVRLLP